jgi:hypothetical protein
VEPSPIRYRLAVEAPSPPLHDPGLAARLEHDGYAIVDQFLDAAKIGQLLELFHSCDSPIHTQPFGASIFSDDLEYRAAVDRGIKEVIRPKVDTLFNGYRHCFSNFVVKKPQPETAAAGEVPVHQDITFVDESRHLSLGLWCPLVETSLQNGCLLVAPGSHTLNTGPRAPGTAHPYRQLDPIFHKKQLKTVPMKAGSAMIFSQRLFHASPPNHGTAVRVVVGGLFVPREAQLYCYYNDPSSPGRMEVFEVDDLFYTRYLYRSRPEGVPCVGSVDYRYDRITPRQLAMLRQKNGPKRWWQRAWSAAIDR